MSGTLCPRIAERNPFNVRTYHLQARRAFKKMPILSELSRRFHMLTTDAKPDPPRTGIPGYTHNLPPTEDEEAKKTRSKSTPTKPPEELQAHKNDKDDDNDEDVADVTASVRRQKSVPNDATPTRDFGAKAEDLGHTGPTNESKEYKRPRTRTKAKHAKYCKYDKDMRSVLCLPRAWEPCATMTRRTLNASNYCAS